jgi:hypothetical protein
MALEMVEKGFERVLDGQDRLHASLASPNISEGDFWEFYVAVGPSSHWSGWFFCFVETCKP